MARFCNVLWHFCICLYNKRSFSRILNKMESRKKLYICLYIDLSVKIIEGKTIFFRSLRINDSILLYIKLNKSLSIQFWTYLMISAWWYITFEFPQFSTLYNSSNQRISFIHVHREPIMNRTFIKRIKYANSSTRSFYLHGYHISRILLHLRAPPTPT